MPSRNSAGLHKRSAEAWGDRIFSLPGREGEHPLYPVRQSGALKQKECSYEWNLLAWFLSARLTGASLPWLKFRKENGTIACREKVCSRTVAKKAVNQDKVRMMKAELPELQFPVDTRGTVAKADDTPCRAGRCVRGGDVRRQPARNDPCQGKRETNGASNRIATPRTRKFGIACSRPSPGSVWRRSRHNTQMPGVMAGTTAHGRTATRIRSGRPDRKRLWTGEGRGRQQRPLQLFRPGSTHGRHC